MTGNKKTGQKPGSFLTANGPKTAMGKGRAARDFAIVVVVSVFVFCAAAIFDFFEKLQKFVGPIQAWQIDELLLALLTYGLGCIWFGYRRLWEAKATKEALQETEERFRQVAESSGEWIWEVDANGMYTYASPVVEKILGYKPEEVVGKKYFYDFFAPDEREQLKEAAFKVFARKESFRNFVNPNVHKHGHPVILETSGLPILDEEGNLLGYRGADTDVTERQEMQKELQEREERFKAIADYTNDWESWHGTDGRLLWVNPAVAGFTGYSIEECMVMADYPLPLIYEEDREMIARDFRRAIEGRTVGKDLPCRVAHKDGVSKWVTLSWQPIYDSRGGYLGIRSSARDVTDRMRFEEAVRVSRESFHNIVERSADGIIIVGSDGVVRFTNPAVRELFGRRADKLIGEQFGFPVVAGQSTEIEIVRPKEGVVVAEMRVVESEWQGESAYLASVRDITERKEAEKQIQLHLHRLRALHEIENAISGSQDLDLTLKVLTERAVTRLGVDAVDVLLLDPYNQVLKYVVGMGFRTPALRHTRLRVGEGNAGRAAFERRMVSIPILAEAEGGLKRSPLLSEEGFVSYYGVPLIARGQVRGVMEVFHRSLHSPDPEWMDFLGTLATQAAIAIDNTELFIKLQESKTELIMAYDATLEGWARAMDRRSGATEGHTVRVAHLTLRMAQDLGVRDDRLAHVGRGALLHELGKMYIPEKILLKDGPLTEEEYEIMRKEPIYAYELLSLVAFLRPALDIPYCHHEKWDGTGYPQGLEGEQIPLAARIFSLAHEWESLRSGCPRSPAWPEDKLREHIRSQAGTHFDPKVVELFLGMEW